MAQENWRGFLPMLEGLPLLPCGAGEKYKAPINPDTGRELSWKSQSFTADQIAGMNSLVRCVGFKPGPEAGYMRPGKPETRPGWLGLAQMENK